MAINSVILLPLALWQTVGAGYHLTGRDLVAGIVLGVVCTALAYTLWTEGMRRMRVQHTSILGYLEPVSAPFYALLLLGQRPGLDADRRRAHRRRRRARRDLRRARAARGADPGVRRPGRSASANRLAPPPRRPRRRRSPRRPLVGGRAAARPRRPSPPPSPSLKA